VLDVTGRLAGRGAYLCADAACVDAATKKRALDRALEVTVPPELLVGLPVTPDEHPMTSGGTRGQE
jgi:predicted RNA-binding protein YlxR (DUF448 family)